MKIWEDFKAFAFKGNVLDMAVGVIIGQAFGKIVTSIVSDIIMPFFGYIMSGMQFTDMKIVLNEQSAIMYGNFIQNVVDFLIISASIFLFIRLISKIKNRNAAPVEAEPEVPKGPTTEELLVEIRDLLKK